MRRAARLGILIVVLPFCALRGQQWGVSLAHTWSLQEDWLNPWPAGQGTEGYFARADFAGGLTYRRQIKSRIAFQPELWLTTKGTGYRPNTSHETILRYLEMPVTVRFFGARPGKSGIRPSISTGIAPAVLVSCHWRPHGSAELSCSDTASTISYRGQNRKTPRTDMGLVVGTGVERRDARNSVIGVDLRFVFGRRDLDDRRAELTRRNYQALAIATYVY